MPGAVVLIPAVRQRLWGWPAVLNFACGGLGAGAYVVAVLAGGLAATPAVSLTAWLGPLLVLAGFGAVALEAGRPFRGARLLARLGSSWMSRELLLGGAFVFLALGELVAPSAVLRGGAAAAATAFVLAQGCILRRARAVAAWHVAPMPVTFLASALVSGVGALLTILAASGAAIGGAVLGTALMTVVSGFVVWLVYITWSPEESFAQATRALREGGHALTLGAVGYLLPFAALTLAATFGAGALAALAGVLMVAGQVHAKALVILTAAELRAITVPTLTASRRTS